MQARRDKLLFLLLALVVCLLPVFTRNAFYLNLGVFIALYSLIAGGLGLLLGYAGQVSLGHAAFYGLGAYGSAVLTLHYHVNAWLAMVIAALFTALVAYLIGLPTLKLHGHYLAMATLGFGIIVVILFNEGGAFTGGPSGLPGIPDLAVGNFVFSNDYRFYWLLWALVLVQLVLNRNLLRSRFGRALRAVHSSEIAAQSCAVNTGQVKLAVFVLSAVYASLAGSFYAHFLNFVNPNPFNFVFSIELVVMVLVGGAGNLLGPVLGVAVFSLLHQLLTSDSAQHLFALAHLPDDRAQALVGVLFGLLLVLILIFRPQGLASLLAPAEGGADGR